jgi:DNA-binding NarL/FixJ family response regulator
MGLTQAEAELGDWARAGVVGYTGVDATLDGLVRAVERAFRSGPRSEPAAASPAPRIRIDLVAGTEDAQRRLTLREHEIMRLVGEGYSNQQIARRLCIALGTVKNHIHNVLEKLDVQTRLEAVNAVRRVGFVRWHGDGPMFTDDTPVGSRVSVAVGSG